MLNMKGQVLLVIFLIIFVFTKAKWISDEEDDNDSDFDLFLRSIFHHQNLRKHSPVKQREILEFTEDQRKLQDEALITHNILRAKHCVPPLILDDEVNTRAQIYAEFLAINDTTLFHSTDRLGQFGESLYSIERSRPITNVTGFGEKVTLTWYAEAALYDYTKPGYAKNIAHFSQIVWKDSERLGVGFAFSKAGRKMFVVTQYGPPGNYGYAFSTNVLEPTC
ncbi:hypothetical protein I4U23_008480 [Adineta vaga]|nr:hypothetical protein I4U23_008480 [Adineta vaga]